MNTPILILAFNRLEEIIVLIEKLKKIQPTKIYFSQDGPRMNSNDDLAKCIEVRNYIIKNINWKCELKTNFNKSNLGCRKAVSLALNWFFENEEIGIILEDDCIPSNSFFVFCDQMLKRYKKNNNIYSISGSNFQKGNIIGDGDYYFSKYAHCWGWATWRRAWNCNDDSMKFWKELKNNDTWNDIHDDMLEKKYWIKIFEKVISKKLDSWAYVWLASIWNKKGLNIIPNKNLILNIGFNENATTTVSSSKIETQSIIFNEFNQEIKDPSINDVNVEADYFVFQNHFNGKYNFWPWRFLYLLKILFNNPKTFWLRLKKYI